MDIENNNQKVIDLGYLIRFLELLPYPEYNKLCIDETLLFGFKMKKEYIAKKYMVYPEIDELMDIFKQSTQDKND